MVSDAQAAALVVAGILIILAIRLRTSGARRMLVALARSEPREFRARARLLDGTGARHASSWAALYEAIGLFWEGSFDRALGVTRRIGLPHAHRSTLVLALDVQCLILSGRVAEARRTFDHHRARLLMLAPNVFSIAGGTTIEGFLWFHEDELDRSRARLELVRSTQRRPSPARRLVDFYLAAIAHREGRAHDASAAIEAARTGGGTIFVMQQASDARDEIYRAARSPQPASSLTEAPHKARRRRHTLPVRLLARGLDVLCFRRAASRGVSLRNRDFVALLLLSFVTELAVRLTEYQPRATFYTHGALQVAAPILLVGVAAAVGAVLVRLDQPHAARRIAGAFYSALPLLLGLSFLLARLLRQHPSISLVVQLGLASWATAAFTIVVRSAVPTAPVLRALGAGIGFLLLCVLPMSSVLSTPLWLPHYDRTSYVDEEAELAAFFFDQSEKIHDAESRITAERPNVDDLYFVGFAGWGKQDVFVNEVSFAKTLFDTRFDTAGRSIALSNDRTTRDAWPAASTFNLRHVLKAVGARMNRDEDILFLLVTSHGSQAGLGIESPWAPSLLDDSQLTPAALRAMLDEAGIKWRVLMVAGCYTGVFVPALQNDHTLIATASSGDTTSFGCQSGLQFTEFGRAVLAEQLDHKRSFITAFTEAAVVIREREQTARLPKSYPQLVVGKAITQKLERLHVRLDGSRE